MNKVFNIDWKEKAALDVFILIREKGLDHTKIEWCLFDGSNYAECEKFLNGNYDKTLNYPNIIEQGVVKEVKKGNVIIKYKNEYKLLE